MKRLLISILIFILSFSLTACRQLTNIKYEDVEVLVVDKYYRSSYITPIICGSVRTFQSHPAEYKIVVKYNNIEYTLHGSNIYNEYKNKVGQTVFGTLETRVYDDGSTRLEIISLQ